MARISQEEFSKRFLEGEIDLSPSEEVEDDGGIIIELDDMPYEKTALRLREIVQRDEGEQLLYLKVDDTMVDLGNIEPSVELFNELERLLKTLGIKITKDGEEIDRSRYLGHSKLPTLTESDYLV